MLITATIFFTNIINLLLYGCQKGCLLSVMLEMWIFICPKHELLSNVVYTELMSVFSAINKDHFVFKVLQLLWCLFFEK